MPLRLSIVILTLLLSGLWPEGNPAFAAGTVSGGLLFGVGQYRAEVDGKEVRSVSSNYQQVALRYNKKGTIGDSRLGNYTLMLGYEFNRIAPRVSNYGVNDADFTELTAKKPFYQAAMVLAPGGLPFRLSLYARDLNQSAFVDEGGSSRVPVGTQGGNDRQGNLIDAKLLTGINNGTHRELGGTFLLGIRNGSYLGAYRDVLSQLPRLLIDYKQVEVRDLSRDRNQQHNRSRDLAFVSLNKLDNWVHLRMHDYSDFIDSENDYARSQVIIGSIDQLMQRKWINLTNWVRISGDLSYSVADESRKAAAERTYLVNMMAIGQRQNVNTTVFSRFSRATTGQQVAFETDLPVTMTIDLDRDTRLRSRLIYEASQQSFLDGVAPPANPDPLVAGENATRDCYLDLQLEMFRSRNIVVVPRFEVESRSERNDRDGLALRAGSEVRSNSKRGHARNWLGGYALTASRSEDGMTDEGGTYLENKIYGRVDHELDRRWRVGGDATLAAGSGSGEDLLAFRIPHMSRQLQVGGGGGGGSVDNSGDSSITRGHLTLYLEHRHQQLENRLEVSAESVATDGETSRQLELSHRLNYAQAAHRFKWASVVNIGDNSGTAAAVSFDYLATGTNDGSTSKRSWSSDASYAYDPTRSLGLTLGGKISETQTDEQLITYALTEKLVYRLFTSNGIIRRIAEFTEEFGYEKVGSADVNGRDSSLYGRLSAAYYPTRYIYGKLRSEFTSYPGSSALQQVNRGEVGLDYDKLKIMASYTEGKKSRESALLPEVAERRWEVTVKKIF